MTSKAASSDIEREALGEALASAFAAGRLAPASTALFEASAVPGFALWVHAVHPLSRAFTAVSASAWLACVLLAVGLFLLARRHTRRLSRALPRAAPVAGIHLARRDGLETLASRMAGLAAAAATPLALHALAPGVLPDGLVGAGGRGLAPRHLDRHRRTVLPGRAAGTLLTGAPS